MKVELITAKSKKLKDIQQYISQLSSVVRDKSPKNAEKLFNRLLTESVGEKASRVLEYIPCHIKSNITDLDGVKQFFGFFGEDGTYYTNARELLNWGWSLDKVLKYVDFTHYKVFKCESPYYIYGQISTHNQLTTVSHSQRYAKCDRGYWCPPEVRQYMIKLKTEDDFNDWWARCVETFRPYELRELMKKSGVTRKEIFDRGSDMLQNRVFVIGGYTNNPNAWEHFINQRTDKHTQLETRLFADEFMNYFCDAWHEGEIGG